MEPILYMNKLINNAVNDTLKQKAVKVKVTDDSHTLIMDADGAFRCPHDSAVVEPPCCNGTDCDCQGLWSVSCPDCDNSDLSVKDIQNILEQGED